MKRLILLIPILVISFAGLLAAPNRALAEPTNLMCYYNNDDIYENDDGCDLAIDKQVSTDGGASFEDATTVGEAQTVTVGDTVIWKITVTNDGPQDSYPGGLVTVSDILPEGVTLTNASASTGEYSDSQWTITLANYYDLFNEDYQEPLPATLTLTTTVTTAGVIENTATLSDYNPNDCGGDGTAGLCEDPYYSDANSANNSWSAFVNVAAKKVVSASNTSVPKAPNTGFGVSNSSPWQTLSIFGAISSLLAVGAILVRKNVFQRANRSS